MILNEKDLLRTLERLDPPKEAAYIKRPEDAVDQVIANFHDPSIHSQGQPLAFGDEPMIRFRSGEVTVWGGQNHVGKSQMLNQYILSLLGKSKSFLMSPEMPFHKSLAYLTNQATRQAIPTHNEIRQFLAYANEDLFLLDQSSTMRPAMILKLIRYVVDTYGVTTVAIDSLMKCGLALDDHNGQAEFVDQLCVTAKALNIHIHLVAHFRKPGQNERPSRYHVRGSSAVVDLCDNVVIAWRNFEKEDARQETNTDAQLADLMAEPDAKLIIDKQRHATNGDGRGFIRLWHHADSRTFLDQPGVMPQRLKITGGLK